MQVSIAKRQYMDILFNIRQNVYESNKEQLKKDLLILRNMLSYIDRPTDKMAVVEKKLTKKLSTGRW